MGGEFGDFELGVLEIGDGLAEHLAFLGVGDGVFENTLAGADGGDGDGEAFLGEVVHGDGEALALGADAVGDGHAHIGEEHLGGILCFQAQFFKVAAALEAFAGGLDDDEGHAFGASGGVGFAGEDDDVAKLAVGDVYLLAVDDVVVAVTDGGGADGFEVGAGAGFGEAEGGDDFAGGHFG